MTIRSAVFRSLLLLAGLALTPPALASAQADSAGGRPTASRAVGPPIQRIATASALSTEPLGSIASVRELADGRVLVNDGARRRLLLMDTTLNVVHVVLDSLTDVANTYGTRPGALIPHRGDSTLFVDPASYALLVLDPAGRLVRVRSVWRVEDAAWLANSSGAYGWPGVDARGRIVYRVPARSSEPFRPPRAGVPYLPPEPDSAFVVAVDLETRMLDTLGTLRIPKSTSIFRRSREGRFTVDQVINPLPSTDDWAVLADGTVAFVRGRDYRIEYRGPAGTWTSSPKLPYEWQRLTDEDKERVVDSVRTARRKSFQAEYVTSMIRWVNQEKRSYPAGFTVPEGYVPQFGFGRDWVLPPGVKFPDLYIYACAPGEEPTTSPVAPRAPEPSAPAVGAPLATPQPRMQGIPSCIPAPVTAGGGEPMPPPASRPVYVVDASELPDYRPPLATGGAARADADGNLWIRTIPVRRTPGGVVYDVVDRRGELTTRLQLPPGYALVGFGKGKVVYLSMRDATGIHLARVRLK